MKQQYNVTIRRSCSGLAACVPDRSTRFKQQRTIPAATSSCTSVTRSNWCEGGGSPLQLASRIARACRRQQLSAPTPSASVGKFRVRHKNACFVLATTCRHPCVHMLACTCWRMAHTHVKHGRQHASLTVVGMGTYTASTSVSSMSSW
jgi:hypothetical protein